MNPRSLLAVAAFVVASSAYSANIVWVSDLAPIGTGTTDNDGGAEGIFGPGAGPYPDQGFVDMLSGAGHAVTRFNPSNSAPLSATNITALNTYDLIIIGRSIASGSFDAAAETSAWNTQITKPLISTNSYLSRASRLGWFTASTLPDQVTNNLTFPSISDPVTSYIVGSTALSGSTMVGSYTEPAIYADATVDARGTSIMTDPPVPGATSIATGTVGAATGQFIVSLPAGTTLAAGTSAGQVLSGYRMHLLVGNREPGTGIHTGIGSAGLENLTTEGEGIFLRSVNVAVNGGVIPEPATVSLLLVAVGSLLRRRRA